MDAEASAKQVSLDVTVRFAETDAMGVVHHSAYIVWFEAGRIAWMETAGVPYPAIASAGYNFAVTEVGALYRAAVRFGDPVRVATRLRELRSRRVAFTYEVRHGQTLQLLATGHSSHICVDDSGRTTKIPDWVIAGLQDGMEKPDSSGLRPDQSHKETLGFRVSSDERG